MKQFAQLIEELDNTNSTNKKVAALAEYFRTAPPDDKLWAIALLSGKRPSRPVNATQIRQFASELSGIPLWLFEESYHVVGDLAETIALTINPTRSGSDKTLGDYLNEIVELKDQTEEAKRDYLHQHWQSQNYFERFVFTKLLTGGFRIGISQKLMTRALSAATHMDEDILAYRIMGNWQPARTTFDQLILEEDSSENAARPYPFYLAYALEDKPDGLGKPEAWRYEYKWDGIRAQMIFRKNEIFLWSRGEELVTDKYPEFQALLGIVPNGTVLDGELLPYPDGEIGTFNDLQKRIGRKTVSKNLLKKVPVILMAYDLLENNHEDIRQKPYFERRHRLKNIIQQADNPILRLSEQYPFDNWSEVAGARYKAREMKSEGLMIKRNDSPYLVGRKKGDWWKWKVEPLTIDGVLTYAMRGHGRRSNLFTDYTFGLWDKGEDGNPILTTFAKAYSGLTDAEFRAVDRFIKKNTLERFGPVRSVKAELVFEIAFEGIAASNRHKSGVAVRFPRMHRWRHDKKPEEANTLDDLKALIP